MAEPVIEQITAEIKKSEEVMRGALATQEEEIKRLGTTTDETVKLIKSTGERYEAQVAELGTKYEQKIGATTAELTKAVERISELEKSGKRGGGFGNDKPGQSLGEQFVALCKSAEEKREDSYMGMRGGVRKGGGPALIVERGIHAFHRDMLRKSSLLLSDATNFAPPMTDAMLPMPQRALRIRSLMDVVSTSAPSIRYIEMTGFGPETGTVVTIATSGTTATVTHSTHGFKTGDRVEISGANEANLNKIGMITVTGASTYTYTIVTISDAAGSGTITARNMSRHGAAAGVSENGLKPEAAMRWVERTANVEVIGHWMPATRQVLDDLPQLRGIVDGELMYGVLRAEDVALLYGTGSTPQIQGIMTHPSAQTFTAVGTDTKLVALRRAQTKVRVAELEPDGYVVNPNDKEDIDLAKGEDGHFIWVSTAANGLNGGAGIWRLPIVETNAMVEGSFLCGSFASGGATLYDREQVNVRFSESHASLFIYNALALLAEERIAVAWKRPEAFVVGSFGDAT